MILVGFYFIELHGVAIDGANNNFGDYFWVPFESILVTYCPTWRVVMAEIEGGLS